MKLKSYSLALITLFITGLLVLACSSGDTCPDVGICEGDATLIGDWELDQQCFSNGASSCSEENLETPDFIETISFREDGSLTITIDGVVCNGSYSFDGEESLDLQADDTNCNFDNTTFSVFDLTPNTVTINPPCREACIKKYVRIN